MQKSKKKEWLFLLLVFCFGITSVNAACDNDKLVELSRQANNIKTNYELTEIMYDIETEEIMDPEDSEYTREELDEMGQDSPYGFKNVVTLNIYNISENIYAVLHDTTTNDKKEIHYDDTDDGTYSELITNVSKPRTFNIEIYSEDPCTVDLLRKIEQITPMHNSYYYMPVCNESDAYYCQEWSTVDILISEEEVRDNELKKQISNSQKVLEEENFWEKNKNIIMIISIVAVVVIILGVGFTMIKRKRSRAI